jgi:hypothetical protein
MHDTTHPGHNNDQQLDAWMQANNWCGRDRLPQGDDNNRMIAPDSQWGLADGLLNSPNRFLAVDGIDADQACCECGGGMVAPEV